MYKKFVALGAICFVGLTACTPNYLDNSPSTAEILPMTQVDTSLKLSKICNNVIASSGTLEQHLAKYSNTVAASNLDDKNAIIDNVLANIQIVKQNIEEIKSFNPASVLKQRTADISLKLNDTESYLRSIKKAVEDNDIENIQNAFHLYMNSIGALKTLSTGL